jgi:hypothetical protein
MYTSLRGSVLLFHVSTYFGAMDDLPQNDWYDKDHDADVVGNKRACFPPTAEEYSVPGDQRDLFEHEHSIAMDSTGNITYQCTSNEAHPCGVWLERCLPWYGVSAYTLCFHRGIVSDVGEGQC